MSVCGADSVLCRFCQRAVMAMAGQSCGELDTSPAVALQGRDWWPQGLTGGPGLWSGLAAPQGANKFRDACNPKSEMKFHFSERIDWVKHKSLLGRKLDFKSNSPEIPALQEQTSYTLLWMSQEQNNSFNDGQKPTCIRLHRNTWQTQLCWQKLSLKQTYETLRIGSSNFHLQGLFSRNYFLSGRLKLHSHRKFHPQEVSQYIYRYKDSWD